MKALRYTGIAATVLGLVCGMIFTNMSLGWQPISPDPQGVSVTWFKYCIYGTVVLIPLGIILYLIGLIPGRKH
jgi:hypothetical protein